MSRASRLVSCVLCSILLAGASIASAQWHGPRHDPPFLNSPNIPDVLRSAIRAGWHARFAGKRIVQVPRDTKNPQHEEIVMRDGERTRVDFPEGSKFQGHIIVETRSERKEFFPLTNELLISPPRHEEAQQRLMHLAERGAKGNVVFSTAPGQRVAGQSTQQLVVSDRQGNVLQRLYIEPRTGVLLKRDVFDPGGARIASFEFTEIDLNPPPFDRSMFRFERRGVKVVTPYDELRTIATKNRFMPYSLPLSSGYRLDEVRLMRPHGEDVLTQTYVSPHGKVSLFEVRSALSPEKLKGFARGDLHFSSWQSGAYTFVLMGSLDQAELDRLAQVALAGTR